MRRDCCSIANFNPRSREGATSSAVLCTLLSHYFNPRSREGATTTGFKDFAKNRFQSTLPRGSDLVSDSSASTVILISIHAPARERRERVRGCVCAHESFQSTLPRGSDARRRADFLGSDISIHAPARERPLTTFSAATDSAFQSTLPRGSDSDVFFATSILLISIHAPARERQFS